MTLNFDNIAPRPRIHKFSAHNSPQLRGPGYLPKPGKNGTIDLLTKFWNGNSYECTPCQIGLTLSHGNEPHVQLIGLDSPRMFRQERLKRENDPNPNDEPVWVMGRALGEPGKPTEPISWTKLSDSQIPSKLGGRLAALSSSIGLDRGHENIVHCQGRGSDLVLTHISDAADSQLAVINPNNWSVNFPERQPAFDTIEKINLNEIDRTEMSKDRRTLILSSNKVNERGGRDEHRVDISWLPQSVRNEMYVNPSDEKYSVKIAELDHPMDFECEEREYVTTIHNEAFEILDDKLVRGYRSNGGPIQQAAFAGLGNKQAAVWAALQKDNYIVTDAAGQSELTEKFDANPRTFSLSAALSAAEKRLVFKALRKAQVEYINILVQTPPSGRQPNPPKPIKIKGTTGLLGLWRITKTAEYKKLSRAEKKAVKEVFWQSLNIENAVETEPKKIRSRYVIQYYRHRESIIKDVLKGNPQQEGEAIIVTKVLASARVIHLDEENGQKKGDCEVVPLNFDPVNGHPEDWEHVRIDLRPKAVYKSTFCTYIDTAIAPQFLMDPATIGTEFMASIWPKVDQLGFFGPYWLSAMAFPDGNQFSNISNAPWWVQWFGTVSHSIFDAKADAGREYSWLGFPHLKASKMSVGAAMVTGPNTHSVNPVWEGHLFPVRIPGRPRNFTKTEMPGSYLLVIEDAQKSYHLRTMFGKKTETTTWVFSGGGGLDNYQAGQVQRDKRWNAGIDIGLMDGLTRMFEDFTRGTALYRGLYNGSQAIEEAVRTNILGEAVRTAKAKGVDFTTCERSDATAAMQSSAPVSKPKSIVDKLLKLPLPKQFKMDELREWLNVGTWYFVAAAKLISYSMVPALILFGVMPIPVAGTLFLLACLAGTITMWPFWANQMMKVGVAPKHIISASPKHLIWGDVFSHTMLKSGFDIERLGVGRFIVTVKDQGNRVPANDKKTIFWAGMALPLAAGGGTILTSLAITFAFGIPLMGALTAGAPFALGLLLSRLADRWAARLLPNPNSRSAGKSVLRFIARNAPLAVGAAVSLFTMPYLAVFGIPLITAAMAGGWSIFMGYNIFKGLNHYHDQQREVHAWAEPNPVIKTIPKHLADTWRNTFKEAFGIKPPVFTKREFTSSDNPNIDPDTLWKEINTKHPGLLDKPGPDALANLNSLIAGEDIAGNLRLVYLLSELKLPHPTLRQSLGSLRDLKIWWLVRRTEPLMSDLTRGLRQGGLLNPEDYERISELNHMLIEKHFPAFTPSGRYI